MYDQIDSNKRKTALLIGLFLSLVIGIGIFLNQYMGYGYEVVVVAVIISGVMSITSYYYSDKIALATTGAKPITKEENPYVYRIVENLCMTNGMPVPKSYIIPSPALNAFATGRDPQHASISCTW